ncbi:MAG: DUF2808 domain-containing protein [Scytonema sp. PMC 1069.18]|nr:DUF2808 domain-containing protein [Scytonema sp. PMC 1069.18]MEC4882565.1 DUF2808 domain-containing protein [Scytonema sp. PMC 1070.18]
MRVPYILSTTIALGVTLATSSINLSQAVQLRDGKVYFTQPPYLLGAKTTYNGVNMWGAKYYFTINIPENAGEPLQKITINQRDAIVHVRFDLEDSFAFEGTPSDRGQKLKIQDVTRDRETNAVSITFEPPLRPGQTVTIGLQPKQNPSVPGVYLFGVTAFPSGEQPHGQFLGYGRLQFYGGDIDSYFFPRFYRSWR